VDSHVLQAELLEYTVKLAAAHLFLEGGGGNLAKPDLIVDRLRLGRLRAVKRRFQRGIPDQIRVRRRRSLRTRVPAPHPHDNPTHCNRSQHDYLQQSDSDNSEW